MIIEAHDTDGDKLSSNVDIGDNLVYLSINDSEDNVKAAVNIELKELKAMILAIESVMSK